MSKQECTNFLRWCLPRLRLKWEGYRKVHGQVCKRLRRRMRELDLPGFSAYREYLQNHAGEWEVLHSLCFITISRFYRERQIFDRLKETILPQFARQCFQRGEKDIRCWSAGCASGEEPFSLQILWQLGVKPFTASDIQLKIIATDANANLLKRAEKGRYPPGALRELPQGWKDAAFLQFEGTCQLKQQFRDNIEFLQQDIRREMPSGKFQLILCRYLVFTYFKPDLQRQILDRLFTRLAEGGCLVIGRKEKLAVYPHLQSVDPSESIFQKQEA